MCTPRWADPGLNLGLQDAVNLGWKLAAVLNGQVEPAICSPPMRPSAGPPPSGSSCTAGPSWRMVRPGPEVTALREFFSELVTEPGRRPAPRRPGVRSGKPLRRRQTRIRSPGTGCPTSPWPTATERRRIAELARDGRPLLIDLTEGGEVAAAVTDIADRLTVAVGRPVGDVAATALLVRPDGYVAWAHPPAYLISRNCAACLRGGSGSEPPLQVLVFLGQWPAWLKVPAYPKYVQQTRSPFPQQT